jgi:hypothetical protein
MEEVDILVLASFWLVIYTALFPAPWGACEFPTSPLYRQRVGHLRKAHVEPDIHKWIHHRPYDAGPEKI